MALTALAIVAVLLLSYVWSLRGFFSALVHLICVVIAGGIAFAVWEPVGYLLLSSAPLRGFASGLVDIAWGLALALPFAISLGLLRALADGILRANAQVEPAINYIGGGVCGLLSAIISVGVLVIALGYVRRPPMPFYESLEYSNASPGAVEQKREFLRPRVDEWTAALYTKLSERLFNTLNPLGRWAPHVADMPSANRMSFDEGRGRTALRPKDVKFIGTYAVGDMASGAPFTADLTGDEWNPGPQKPVDIHGEPLTTGYVFGVAVNLQPGATDRGQFLIGATQAQLVVESADRSERKVLHPIALCTQSDKTDTKEFARFRFDSPELYFASVGAATDRYMAFEFAVPTTSAQRFRPIAMYIKGCRINLEASTQPAVFESTQERDDAVRSQSLFGGTDGAGRNLDSTGAAVVEYNPRRGIDSSQTGISTGASLGFSMQNTERGTALTTVEAPRGGHEITTGDGNFNINVTKMGNVDRNLRINGFAVPNDSVLVRVNVTDKVPTSLLADNAASADRSQPAQVMDPTGTAYDCVGYIYKDAERIRIRYTLESPLRMLSEAPAVSRSKSDQNMILLFRVNRGVKIEKFVIGSKVIAEFNPPLTLN